MNTLLKSLGGIFLLIGVGILAVPAFSDFSDNKYLAIGLITIIFGYLLHIFLNRKFQ